MQNVFFYQKKYIAVYQKLFEISLFFYGKRTLSIIKCSDDLLTFTNLCRMYSSIRKSIWQCIKNCLKIHFFFYGKRTLSIMKCSDDLLTFTNLCRMYPSIGKSIWQCTKNCLNFHFFSMARLLWVDWFCQRITLK